MTYTEFVRLCIGQRVKVVAETDYIGTIVGLSHIAEHNQLVCVRNPVTDDDVAYDIGNVFVLPGGQL